MADCSLCDQNWPDGLLGLGPCTCFETGENTCKEEGIDNRYMIAFLVKPEPLILEECQHYFIDDDTFCDGENNNEACEYDGGDCCIEGIDCTFCDEAAGTCDCNETEAPKCGNSLN